MLHVESTSDTFLRFLFINIVIHSFLFFFINGFNHRYKNLSLDASIYVTLHVSVCISVNKLVQIYCETPRKKNR